MFQRVNKLRRTMRNEVMLMRDDRRKSEKVGCNMTARNAPVDEIVQPGILRRIEMGVLSSFQRAAYMVGVGRLRRNNCILI